MSGLYPHGPAGPSPFESGEAESRGFLGRVREFVGDHPVASAMSAFAVGMGVAGTADAAVRSKEVPSRMTAERSALPAETFSDKDGDGKHVFILDEPNMSFRAKVTIPSVIVADQRIPATTEYSFKPGVKLRGSTKLPDGLRTKSGKKTLPKKMPIEKIFGNEKMRVTEFGLSFSTSTEMLDPSLGIFSSTTGTAISMLKPLGVKDSLVVEHSLDPISCTPSNLIDLNRVPERLKGINIGPCLPAIFGYEAGARIRGEDKYAEKHIPKSSRVKRTLDQSFSQSAVLPVVVINQPQEQTSQQ
jgi:hypothetical protein